MLRISVRLTHQVAVFLSPEITHSPPCSLRFDFKPSTALLAWDKATVIPVHRFSWYAGFFNATFSVNLKFIWMYMQAFDSQLSIDKKNKVLKNYKYNGYNEKIANFKHEKIQNKKNSNKNKIVISSNCFSYWCCYYFINTNDSNNHELNEIDIYY